MNYQKATFYFLSGTGNSYRATTWMEQHTHSAEATTQIQPIQTAQPAGEIAPGPTSLGTAEVFVFEDDWESGPEGLGHVTVIPGAGRGLDHDTVVPYGHALGQGVVRDREILSWFVVPGEVVTDTEQGVFEVLEVQIDMTLLDLDLILLTAGMGIAFAPDAVGAYVNEINPWIPIVACACGGKESIQLLQKYGIIEKGVPGRAIGIASSSVGVERTPGPGVFDPFGRYDSAHGVNPRWLPFVRFSRSSS